MTERERQISKLARVLEDVCESIDVLVDRYGIDHVASFCDKLEREHPDAKVAAQFARLGLKMRERRDALIFGAKGNV